MNLNLTEDVAIVDGLHFSKNMTRLQQYGTSKSNPVTFDSDEEDQHNKKLKIDDPSKDMTSSVTVDAPASVTVDAASVTAEAQASAPASQQ